MKFKKILLILLGTIMLTSCIGGNYSLSKQKDILSIIKQIDKSFPEDKKVLEISLFSSDKFNEDFSDATVIYSRENKYYSLFYYEEQWNDPIKIKSNIRKKFARPILDFKFDEVEKVYSKVYDELQKEQNNNIDKFVLTSISQRVTKNGKFELNLTISVTKKDEYPQISIVRKRLNGVGKKKALTVSKTKYYTVDVSVNENGSLKKRVDFSKGDIYEQETY